MRRVILGVISALFISFLLGGCLESTPTETGKPSTSKPLQQGKSSLKTAEISKTRVTLYYPDQEAQFLKREEIEITSTPSLIQVTVERLFQGPRRPGLTNPFPPGIKLLGVNLKGETLEINFDRSLKQLYPRGSAAEDMFIYSIVNTVTEFPGVKKVKFLVDGKAQEIIGSNYDFSTEEFSRDVSLIAR